MIMVAMSYFCRQNVSQISLEIVVNCSHPSEILALGIGFFFAVLCALSRFAIISLVKRELVALLLLCSKCHVAVIVL